MVHIVERARITARGDDEGKAFLAETRAAPDETARAGHRVETRQPLAHVAPASAYRAFTTHGRGFVRPATLAFGLLAAAISVGLSAGGAAAQDLICGGEYTIKRGDTLQKVVNRVYGPEHSYVLLHRANRDIVGRDPSLIEIGATIRIPCLEGLVETSADGAPEETQTAAAQAPATETTKRGPTAPAPEAAEPAAPTPAPTAAPTSAAPLRIVTASGWAPYLDEDQAEGGMLAALLRAALARAAPASDYRIDFINDRGALLRPLIADGAYDVSLAWIRPDCETRGAHGPEPTFRCDELAWSDPLFELIIGFYTRADAPAPSAHRDLIGKSVCRPAGASAAVLEARGLFEPDIRLVAPESADDCFNMLLAGEVDAVVVATSTADDAIAALGAAGAVAEQPQLAAAAALRAVTSIHNPRKDDQLNAINEGLRLIREDGTWFEIVQRHLIAHARPNGAG